MFAECVAAIQQARRIPNNDTDLFDLPLRKFKREQFHPRFVAVGRAANNSNELIEIGKRNEVPFERFGAFFCLA